MNDIDVIIADDHKLIRETLARYLEQLPFVASVHQASNGKEVLALTKTVTPDIVLMDIKMPEMNGVECSEILFQRYRDIKILALTSIEDPKSIVRMLEIGVQGYLLKNTDLDELERGIKSVVEKDFYQNKLIVDVMRHELVSKSTAQYDPTEREKKILKLICREKSASEIAKEFNLSHRTVEVIRGELAKKLGVKGIVGLVRYAIKNGYDL